MYPIFKTAKKNYIRIYIQFKFLNLGKESDVHTCQLRILIQTLLIYCLNIRTYVPQSRPNGWTEWATFFVDTNAQPGGDIGYKIFNFFQIFSFFQFFAHGQLVFHKNKLSFSGVIFFTARCYCQAMRMLKKLFFKKLALKTYPPPKQEF